MSPDHASPAVCPEHFQLLALLEGKLPSDEEQALTEHVVACDACDARLDELEEHSDTLVQILSHGPANADDEPTFRKVQEALLANPEPFSGDVTTDPTHAITEDLPMEMLLPFHLGNYELLEQIGAGAHGAVFRARHRRLEREVAVKLLLRPAGPFVQEFLNEMRVVGQLDHPNIIRATDAGEHEGTYFLVMEFVPGLDVSSLLLRSGPMSVPNACEIARQTALGLEFAHQHDLVHRDVKTSNLLLSADGQTKLLDLGLAMIPAHAGQKPKTTISGPRGTADYMAPEQWHEASQVTHKADLYSLGCTLYKLLTGKPPYRDLPDGITTKQQAHSEAEIPLISATRDDIPLTIEKLVTELLAKSANDRPSSAKEVAQRLTNHASESNLPLLVKQFCPELKSTSSPATSALTRTQTFVPPRINRRKALLLGTLGVTAAAAFVVTRYRPPSESLDTDVWRPLGLASPALIRLGDVDESNLRADGNEYELSSPNIGLLHFGQPVANWFRWKTQLVRDSWQTSAGIFFALRKAGDKEHSFQTLEIQSDENASHDLLSWCFYENPNTKHSPLGLADAIIPRCTERVEFDLTLGRSGFPEIKLDGQPMPESKWKFAKEGRDILATNTAQIPERYAGRIGVIHRGGKTTIQSTQIKYLENRG